MIDSPLRYSLFPRGHQALAQTKRAQASEVREAREAGEASVEWRLREHAFESQTLQRVATSATDEKRRALDDAAKAKEAAIARLRAAHERALSDDVKRAGAAGRAAASAEAAALRAMRSELVGTLREEEAMQRVRAVEAKACVFGLRNGGRAVLGGRQRRTRGFPEEFEGVM